MEAAAEIKVKMVKLDFKAYKDPLEYLDQRVLKVKMEKRAI